MVKASHDSAALLAYIRLMVLTPQKAPIFALLLSGGLLVGAWVFQYGFGYAPCQMCYWQRHAHKLVLGLAALALGLSYAGRERPRLFAGLLALALLISFALAFWHVGVEYKWWDGPKSCSTGGDLPSFDLTDPLAALDKSIKPPACTDAVWHFLGLSMAAWNALASLIGAGLMLLSAKQKGASYV